MFAHLLNVCIRTPAREHGVFVRARTIKTAGELLRAILLYGIGDLPLRSVAGWFTGEGQNITDQARRPQ